MKRSLVRFSAILALALAYCPSNANAWDSVTRNAVRNFRRNTRAVNTDKFQYSRHLTLQITKDRIGGTTAGGADDVGVGSLVSCPANFDDIQDFASCTLASRADLPDDKGV